MQCVSTISSRLEAAEAVAAKTQSLSASVNADMMQCMSKISARLDVLEATAVATQSLNARLKRAELYQSGEEPKLPGLFRSTCPNVKFGSTPDCRQVRTVTGSPAVCSSHLRSP